MFDSNEARDAKGRWTSSAIANMRAESARHGTNALGNKLRKQADDLERLQKQHDVVFNHPVRKPVVSSDAAVSNYVKSLYDLHDSITKYMTEYGSDARSKKDLSEALADLDRLSVGRPTVSEAELALTKLHRAIIYLGDDKPWKKRRIG